MSLAVVQRDVVLIRCSALFNSRLVSLVLLIAYMFDLNGCNFSRTNVVWAE